MAPILGYWDIRGLANPIRMILAYTGTEFEEKAYVHGPPEKDWDRSCWLDEKFKLGLDLPNLPYLIDGDIKITQSNAIIRHIGRINSMDGKTEAEKVRVDMMTDELMDFRNGWVRLCYGDFEASKVEYIKKANDKVKQFSEFLGNRKWIAGDYLTFPDFIMFELLEHHLHLIPDLLTNFNNLAGFMENFKQLEPMKAYWASKRFKKRTLNGPMAKFGGGRVPQ